MDRIGSRRQLLTFGHQHRPGFVQAKGGPKLQSSYCSQFTFTDSSSASNLDLHCTRTKEPVTSKYCWPWLVNFHWKIFSIWIPWKVVPLSYDMLSYTDHTQSTSKKCAKLSRFGCGTPGPVLRQGVYVIFMFLLYLCSVPLGGCFSKKGHGSTPKDHFSGGT